MTSFDALRARGSGTGGSVLDALVGGAPGGVKTVPTSMLHPKANHTFVIRKDTEYFRSLRESIRENGVQTPLLARRHPTIPNEYEILAGHTRHTIARELGIAELPVRLCSVDDNDADILMMETNIQRPDWLPSEKARSYAVWLEAIRRKRAAEAPGEPQRGKSVDLLAEERGFDGETLRRYIKLNDLIAPLLDMTDAERITVKAAYQLSFLCEEDQRAVAGVLAAAPVTSIKENAAKALRVAAEQDYLTERAVREALGLAEKASKPKSVSFSVPEDAFDDAKVAKRYRNDAAFQAALARWIRRYIAEGGA